jgi:hypothetical protein
LRDDESGFNRFPQTHFISKDAPAARNALERKHHGVDLVRIRVDATLPLGGRLTAALTRRSKSNEIFREVAAVDGMAEAFFLECRWHRYLP